MKFRAIIQAGDQCMLLEFREWRGVRMTYLLGKPEPVWLIADLVRKLGHVPRVARRLRWNRQDVRLAFDHAEWNADQITRERAAALEAGYCSDLLMDSPHALVFPGSLLKGRPAPRRRRRCRNCR